MHIRKRHLFRWIAVGFAVAATAALAAQPDVSSNDRALYRGTSATLAPTGLSPDDRPFARVASATLAPTGVSPDDRPFARVASATLAPTGLSPDDRPFARVASATLAPTGVSPDDRPFMRSVGEIEPRTVPVEVITSPRGFDWGDAAIGSAFGLTMALLGMGVVQIATRRRRMLSPA